MITPDQGWLFRSDLSIVGAGLLCVVFFDEIYLATECSIGIRWASAIFFVSLGLLLLGVGAYQISVDYYNGYAFLLFIIFLGIAAICRWIVLKYRLNLKK